MGCFATNFFLRRQWETGDGPPFLGMAAMDGAKASAAIWATRQFLGGDPGRLGELFVRFPFVAAWCIAHPLRGDELLDAEAAYGSIGHLIGVDLAAPAARQALHDGFAAVCRLVGLPVAGFAVPLALYRLQAGMADDAIAPVVTAFLAQESLFGPPPTESTALLKGWQDAALAYLPAGQAAAHCVLAGDDTAYHAALFARLRIEGEEFQSAHPFERAFRDMVLARGGDEAPPSPRPAPATLPIAWADGGPALLLPRGGSAALWAEGDPEPLQVAGAAWPLVEPWPRTIHWRTEAGEGVTPFLTEPDAIAIIDLATGLMVADRAIEPGTCAVDATDVAILARRPFRVDGEDAVMRSEGASLRLANLAAGPVRIDMGRRSMLLSATARRRIGLAGGVIAHGPLAALRSTAARVRVETGVPSRQSRSLRLEFGTAVGTAIVETDDDGNLERPLAALLQDAFGQVPDDPEALRIELLPPEGSARGVSVNTFVWPAFRTIEGHSLHGGPVPANFVAELSPGVETGGGGLRLAGTACGRGAQAVFEIAGAYVPFEVPCPETALMRHRADAPRRPIAPGARITAGAGAVGDVILVHSPDPAAALTIMGRHEPQAFAVGPVRAIAIDRRAADAADGRVLLTRGDGAVELLFDIVPPLAPAGFAVRYGPLATSLVIDLPDPAEAVSVRLEDELGRVFVAAVTVRAELPPVASGWLAAHAAADSPARLHLTIDRGAPGVGLRLARLAIRTRRPDRWQALATPCGAAYGAVLPQASPPTAGPERRFRQLSAFLSDRHAAPVRAEIEAAIVPLWRHLGAAVADRAAACGLMRRTVAIAFPCGPLTSWMPIVHPITPIPPPTPFWTPEAPRQHELPV